MLKPGADTEFVERSELLDDVGLARVLRRIAYEIVERNGTDVYLLGIRTGGAILAERLAAILRAGGEAQPLVGAVDITLYRDDTFLRLPKPEIGPTDLPDSPDGRLVVLVDDVLYTGRTVRAAMDVLADYGRPRAVQLAVLIDRGRRELPIAPDFVGVRLQTAARESVRVQLREVGGMDRVVLRERIDPALP